MLFYKLVNWLLLANVSITTPAKKEATTTVVSVVVAAAVEE